MGDRVGLQQVLMNLMLNGIEAMKDMGAPGKLSISSHQKRRRRALSFGSGHGDWIAAGERRANL